MTPDDLENGVSDIRQFLRSNYPQVAFGMQPVHSDVPQPHPDEARVLSPNAVAKRRLEFAAGRHAARIALRALGQPNCVISKGKNGQPQFPDKSVGSITHTESLAISVATSRENCRGIGIDLELIQRFKPDFAKAVLTSDELLRVKDETELAAHFSAKEATYKAIFATLGKVIGFQDVELSFHEDGACFTAKPVTEFSTLFPNGKEFLKGRVLRTSGMILSVALFS